MLTVDPAPRYRMRAAPLIQALAQVNFPIVPKLQTLDGIAPLHERLADLLPYMNRQVVQQQVELFAGPAGPASSSAQSATIHVFTDDDGWSLQVTTQSATLSAGGHNYRGVDDFRRRLEGVWTALHEVPGIRRCDRLGVRYLNIVELNGEAWADWFQPEIVGVAHPSLSGGVLASTLTETRLRADLGAAFHGQIGQIEGVMRHGVVPSGSLMQGIPPRPIPQRSFILDVDTFVAAPEPFEPKRLAGQFSDLHSHVDKVFHWAVTAAGCKQFGYELMDETGGGA
jgi:uncharacterized protein (TIGR04255 family)